MGHTSWGRQVRGRPALVPSKELQLQGRDPGPAGRTNFSGPGVGGRLQSPGLHVQRGEMGACRNGSVCTSSQPRTSGFGAEILEPGSHQDCPEGHFVLPSSVLGDFPEEENSLEAPRRANSHGCIQVQRKQMVDISCPPNPGLFSSPGESPPPSKWPSTAHAPSLQRGGPVLR